MEELKAKYYVITYTGVLRYGYIKLWFFKKPTIKAEDINLETATKFRFKFLASALCWLMNKDSELNYHFMTFKVTPKFH